MDLLLDLRDVIEVVNGEGRETAEAATDWRRRVNRCAERAYEEVSALIEEQSQ